MHVSSWAAFAPALSRGAALLLGLGCSAALWDPLAARWRSLRGRMAAGALAALPLFLLLRVSVASVRGWGAAGFVRAVVLALLLGALSGWGAEPGPPP